MKKAAFSLVEVIVYIAIASVMVSSLLLFSINLVQTRSNSEFDRELIENARFTLDLISREIRDAEDLNTGTFGSHPGSLTLDIDGGGTLTIDSATKTVNGTAIRYLQVDSTQITSDKVNITNFVLNNLTRSTEPDNIQIELTLESFDGLSSSSFQTSVSLREE